MSKLLGDKKVLAGVALVVALAGFWFVGKPMLLGGSSSGSAVAEQGNEGPSGAAAEGDHGAPANGTAPAHATAAPSGPTYQLKDRILNLSGTPRHYLKLGVALEFKPKSASYYKLAGEAKKKAEEEFALEISGKAPAIEDTITTVVSAKTLIQVSTPAGQAELKRELQERLLKIVGEPEVVKVYFTQFVTQ